MDSHHRGRSPSQAQPSSIRHSPSPSPHAPFRNNPLAVGLNSSPSANNNDPYAYNPHTSAAFDSSSSSSSHFLTTSAADSSSFLLAQQQHVGRSSPSPHFGPSGNHFPPDNIDVANSNNVDFALFPDANSSLAQDQAIDPSFLSSTLDPQLLDSQPQNQNVNPAHLMNQMATTQAHSPTPPHLLQPGMNQRSPSPNASPNMNQGAFPSPSHSHSHSRHTSLDPSAAYAQQQGSEWGGMQFRGHHRAPSETYSDVSSAQASPYLGNHDSFDHENPSPLLHAQNDPSLFQEVMQFGSFNLNDNAHISPAHSPHISPQLGPQQQSLPQFAPNNFGLSPSLNNQFDPSLGGYQGQEAFPAINQGMAPVPDAGLADTMSPPEINIDFAPPSRQASFEPAKPGTDADALSPPDRSRSRNRIRAKSDPFSGGSSRASTPGLESHRSLSPNDAKSRSPSPSTKSSRRSSTSSVPNRDYILDLADPSRPASSQSGDGNPKRTQKHPATFQCTLCPKRFTRAYNLRSHLRTHTDERPFVCSVCGKAFARQHDRKRHEGLHSGEKKFVCRGVLKDAGSWGCGRRFARADALGRHFRSEAGRVCIRPLLEEERQEKGSWDDQNQHMDSGNGMFNPMQQAPFGMIPQAQQGFNQGFVPTSGELQPVVQPQYGLPAALLAQYPALAGIQWDQLPAGGPDEMEGDMSGRSSFDASSGGELFEEDDTDFQGMQQNAVYGGGWASDYEANAR
ncbi:hypothetical protein EJ04DRAFT_510386 [Polyplosphaeria fusca]|uniref:C2H2-type domain-containing protein n=1 Tax=Polyplosphaeria fusca TaxID=682080 RepID=A0A9P4V2C8_9PLEO|nr:hypothetical protein EJ04DRAFT_510386 [Polyplosphaeria fusca]